MVAVLRVARPTDDLERIAAMYRDGLGFEELGRFADHDGFDGIMLGLRGGAYHLEFTHERGCTVGTAPTKEHLLVFYLPLDDEWDAACDRMRRAGFVETVPHNPYWERCGATFEDSDGYRVVLAHLEWNPDS